MTHSEERLMAIIGSATDAIITVDGQQNITLFNEAAEKMFGCPAEQTIGKPLERLIPERFHQAHAEHIRLFGQTGVTARAAGPQKQLIARRADGTEFPVEATISQIGVDGRKLFTAIVRDISERQRADEAWTRKFEELAASSLARLKLAIESVHMGVWDLDLVTDRAWRSELHDQIFGYMSPLDEWGYDIFIKHVFPADREVVAQSFKQAFATGEFNMECRIVWPDASMHWIEAQGRVHRDATGNAVRMMGMVIDITERKRVEEQLQEKNRLLEAAIRSEREGGEALKEAQGRLVQSEKLAALGQLVAGVAHEINNPLAFVMNNAAVMKRDVAQFNELLALYRSGDQVLIEHDPDLHRRIQEYANRIDLPCTVTELDALMARSREGLVRIQQIVKDLRDFARQEAIGDQQHAADLNHGIESTLNIARGQAVKYGIEIEKDLQPLHPLTCRPAKINQVILNLVLNAIDACGQGGKIVVRSRNVANGVELQVIDNGSGIDPAIRGKIFDPFFTTKPQGIGTGLGLSISHGIITEHGGHIRVESELGRGSDFTVFLPLSQPQAARGIARVDGK